MRPPFLLLLSLFLVVCVARPCCASEPFLQPHDVIALVGGEDMVVASEYGYLELLLTRALPDYQLLFRDLACEGDTVFEQRRELNFPTWEEQLERIGATVVLCQFGQMESLGRKGERRRAKGESGEEVIREFIAAYQKLIERFCGGGKRRVVLLPPGNFASADAQAGRDLFADAIRAMRLQPGGLTDISPGLQPGVAEKRATRPERAQESAAPAGADVVANAEPRVSPGANFLQPSGLPRSGDFGRDGIHLSSSGHRTLAQLVGRQLVPQIEEFHRLLGTGLDHGDNVELQQLLAAIRAKNRLWFDYWRPQNWAFLAGDRTSQPSSRDHLDPSKRWFPPEREAFLPLIEAKEKEIHALAQKLAKP